MKRYAILLGLFSTLAVTCRGQGTFIYDQQSSDESAIFGGAALQLNDPIGQSFTPTLSGIQFVRLYLYDGAVGNAQGATVYVNVLANSFNSAPIASTDPIFLPDGFAGTTNFFFAAMQGLTPGVTYYFQTVVQSGGDLFGISSYNYNYSGGVAYFQGQPAPGTDLWFREGIIPEPSSMVLGVLGSVVLFVRYRPRSHLGKSSLSRSASLRSQTESSCRPEQFILRANGHGCAGQEGSGRPDPTAWGSSQRLQASAPDQYQAEAQTRTELRRASGSPVAGAENPKHPRHRPEASGNPR